MANSVKTHMLGRLYDNITESNVANLLMALLCGVVFGFEQLTGWFLLMIFSIGYGVVIQRMYRQQKRSGDEKIELWHRRYVLHVVFRAMVWVAGLWWFFPSEMLWQRLFAGFVFGGLTAASVGSLSHDILAARLYLALMLGNLALWYLLPLDRIDMAMSGMIALYWLFLARSVDMNYKAFIDTLGLRKREKETLKRLEHKEIEFEVIFEYVDAGIIFYDTSLRILKVNKNFAKRLGTSAEKLLGMDMHILKDRRIMPALRAPVDEEKEGFYEGPYRSSLTDRRFYIRLRTKPAYNSKGELIGAVGVAEDIAKEFRARRQIERFARFYTHNPNPIMQISCKKRDIQMANDAAEALHQMIMKESPAMWEDFIIRICRKNEEKVDIAIDGRAWLFDIVEEDGNPILYGLDVTAEKLAKERAEYLAYYDELTGLPRRRLFFENLKRAMDDMRRAPRCGALLFLDLDNFKQINDTMGHDIGDKLLVKLAERLKANIRASDMVGRLGGDEFLIFLDRLGNDKEEAAVYVHEITQKLLSAISEPFVIGNRHLLFSASIGVTIFCEEKDPFTLLKEADTAMYEAKHVGKNTVKIFDTLLEKKIENYATLMQDIHKALKQNEFLLYYQPQVSIESGRCVGAEALLRWQSPEHGFVSPVKFIPVAEESGLIHEIGQWVLKEAQRDLAVIGKEIQRVSVNVSVKEFIRPDYVKNVRKMVEDGIVDPYRITLELTESLIVEDYEASNEKLSALHTMGFELSIDDFGTGYSSLAYLKHLSLEELKIDRSFVKDIGVDADDEALTHVIIHIANHFGMRTVAEGIENEGQLKFLKDAGCNIGQGYYYAKPMPLDQFAAWLKENR